ncbi:hypothetical protein, partial [Pseudomonas syringae]|uniref:hypothetical protein n=1 Tax=Pseudomonas syringae TaxID=317 RepID=UPI00195A76D2
LGLGETPSLSWAAGSKGVVTFKVRQAVGKIDIDLHQVSIIDHYERTSAVMLAGCYVGRKVAVCSQLRRRFVVPFALHINGPNYLIARHFRLLSDSLQRGNFTLYGKTNKGYFTF